MIYRELEKILRSLGYKDIRQKGSHVTWSNGNNKVTVPKHGSRDIPKGTLLSIFKKIGYKT